jgi:hypothetical protein
MAKVIPFPNKLDIDRATEMALAILHNTRASRSPELAAELAAGFVVAGAAVVCSEFGTAVVEQLLELAGDLPPRRGRRSLATRA